MMVRTKLTGQQALPVSLHIKELRSRLLFCALVFLGGSIAGYINQNYITAFMKGLIDESLYYTSPTGNFSFIMKVSAVVGLAITIPVLVFNVLRFIQPALEKRIQYSKIWVASGMALMLALAGIAFAMFFIMPIALRFFAGFRVNGIEALISANSYLDFITKAVMSFAILFQIPLLITIINHIRPIPPRTLLKYERHVIVAAFVVGLLLPFSYDPVTQLIIATPIIVLYNLSIIYIWLSSKKRNNIAKQHHNLINEQIGEAIITKRKVVSLATPTTPETVISNQYHKESEENRTSVNSKEKLVHKPHHTTGGLSDFSTRANFIDLSKNHKKSYPMNIKQAMNYDHSGRLSVDTIIHNPS